MTRRNREGVLDGDDLTLEILYRLVSGRARDRLGKFYRERSPEAIRADSLAGLAIGFAIFYGSWRVSVGHGDFSTKTIQMAKITTCR